MTPGAIGRVFVGIAVVAALSACDAFGTPISSSRQIPGNLRDASFGDSGGRGGQGGLGGFGGIGGFGGAPDAAVKVPDDNDAGNEDAGDEDASRCVPGDCCHLKCTPI